VLSQAFQTQRPKFQAAALKVSTELLQREGGRGGGGKSGEQYRLNCLYIAPQLKYYFLKGRNLFWRHGVITTSTYFHRGVTRSILHCALWFCCFCRTPCYPVPCTVLTVLFNLSQFLRSSGKRNSPEASGVSPAPGLQNPSPRNHRFPPKFLYFYCFRQSGKVIQSKATPSPGLPSCVCSETAGARAHAGAHTESGGLPPGPPFPVPCRRGAAERPERREGLEGSRRDGLQSLGYKG